MPDILSLRDPAGYVVRDGERIFRVITKEGEANARAWLESPTIARFRADGRCVNGWDGTLPDRQQLGVDTQDVLLWEHEKIDFISYPYEWTSTMVQRAGELTIAMARELLGEHRGLKDATPFNIAFRGCTPIFFDALSVEPRAADNPLWIAYGQFVRTFILPMIAMRDLKWSLRATFLEHPDGLQPDALFHQLSWRRRLRRPTRSKVTLPTLLAQLGVGPTSTESLTRSVPPPQATYILRKAFNRLDRALAAAAPKPRTSHWVRYRDESVHAESYHAARAQLVERVLAAQRPKRVLDIGTNDGRYALLAAKSGALVVAIDRDEAVVDVAFRNAERARANVLPLVVDIANPSPGTGWQNTERPSFFTRARDGFDCVLCLAIIHHLTLGQWLSLDSVAHLLGGLTTQLLIAEFVPADDPYSIQLAAGRTITPERWSVNAFEAAFSRRFRIEERHPVGTGTRVVYVLRRAS